MLPEPLHPAVVHLPLALAVLLPPLALVALWRTRRAARSAPPWILIAVLSGVLAASAWGAVQTGESQEELVEDAVPEEALEAHEEAGKRLLYLGGAAFALALLGLAPGRAGLGGRALATAATVVVLVGALDVGRLGGELVYRHGAAEAVRAASGTESEADAPRPSAAQEREER